MKWSLPLNFRNLFSQALFCKLSISPYLWKSLHVFFFLQGPWFYRNNHRHTREFAQNLLKAENSVSTSNLFLLLPRAKWEGGHIILLPSSLPSPLPHPFENGNADVVIFLMGSILLILKLVAQAASNSYFLTRMLLAVDMLLVPEHFLPQCFMSSLEIPTKIY